MVLKERINRPKLCFRVIRPRIILHHVKDHFLYPSLFLFVFTLTYFFFGFLFISLFLLFFRVLLCLVFFSLNVWISGESNFLFRTETFRSSPFENRRLRDPQSFTFSTFALQYGRWSLVRVQKENHQAQKERLLDNFLYQWRDNQRWSFFISNLAT